MMHAFRTASPTACALALAFTFHSLAFAQDDATAKKSFTVVLLPDTQYYSEKYPDNYVAQTLWIRDRRKRDNIKFVIHLGDIVQTSTKKPEWKNADRAMRLLDGVVPYSMVPGNHDMVVKTRDSSLYNEFFSPARFAEEKNSLYRDDAVLRRRIDVLESKRGDGTFPGPFCGISGHRKWVERGKMTSNCGMT